jgi:transposase
MKITSEPLPFDPKTASKSQLAEMVLSLLVQLEAKDTELQANQVEIQTKQVDIEAKELKIQALTFELAHLRRMRYGVKSESLTQLQRDLFTDTWNEDLAAIEAELEALTSGQPVVTAERAKRSRAGRQPLPEHLPRIEHHHEPESCTCGQCGNSLVMIRKDITEQLDVEPAKFFVHRHIRPQYACRQCETMTAAPIPAAIIDGGMAAVGLLVWLLVCKYVDHLPLYRIEQIAARHQVNLARNTLSDWVGRLGVALQPLADRLVWHLLQGNTLHADETPVSQLDPGRGKTKKAYLWAYRSNDLQPVPRIIVFDYQSGRSGACVRQFLGDWQGHLMVDDYSGYKASFNNKKTVAASVELACWAHARRKFFDLVKADQNPMAKEAVERIGGLYGIERQCKDMDITARQQARVKQSQPILEALHQWLTETRARIADGSTSAKAIDYTLRRWDGLTRYAQTGHLPIDNNPVENVIRPIAIGKKNWLFVGSERAGQRAAVIQTLFGTAKLNGLNPEIWLKDTLEKLPTWPNSRIDELLPFDPETIENLIIK